jgi:phosphomannomutase
VIYPTFHAGRDSLIAAALTLSALSRNELTLSGLAKSFPVYYNIKSKALLPDDFNDRLKRFEKEVARLLGKTRVNRADGIRFDFSSGWLQIRSSNTEPIYRLIVETNDQSLTGKLHKQVQHFFK